MTQPLAGLLVLDFSTLLPGPLATLMLAEAGAEVIKIERPDGEEMRAEPPFWHGVSAPYALLNRGKQSLALDLKSDAGRATLAPLLARADILVEQFRPGVMERLGLGYAAVSALNPRIVYCSITGYGQDGPRAQQAGHDLNYIGNTGLLALQPGPADRPVVPPMLVADIGGGSMPAMINILLALRQREQTGRGCHIDIAMTDALFTFAWFALASGQATGRFLAPGESRHAGGSPRYHLYPTRDGKIVACAALEQKFWLAFAQAIGLAPQFIDDEHQREAVIAEVGKILAEKTADEWRPVFAKADCCVTILASLEDALRDPHFVQRGLFANAVAAPNRATMPALPLPLSPAFREPAGNIKPVAPLDADRDKFSGRG